MFVIFFKIIDHVVFSNVCLKFRSFTGKVEETGRRQYNVAIFSSSFFSIEIKNLKIAKHILKTACVLQNERYLAFFFELNHALYVSLSHTD